MSDPIDLKDKYFEILRSLGIVANIMRQPGYLAYDENSFNELLMLKWGYVEDIEGLDEFFEYVAYTFKSPITWTLDPFTKKSTIYPNGFAKWWLFYPSRVDEKMAHKNIPHHEAYKWLRKNEPEFGIKTNKEFNNFVRHLDACYSEWVSSGKLKPKKPAIT